MRERYRNGPRRQACPVEHVSEKNAAADSEVDRHRRNQEDQKFLSDQLVIL
jgi:hypothetical protein